jgi:hypothetical protein
MGLTLGRGSVLARKSFFLIMGFNPKNKFTLHKINNPIIKKKLFRAKTSPPPRVYPISAPLYDVIFGHNWPCSIIRVNQKIRVIKINVTFYSTYDENGSRSTNKGILTTMNRFSVS